jgi:hypothetical protein
MQSSTRGVCQSHFTLLCHDRTEKGTVPTGSRTWDATVVLERRADLSIPQAVAEAECGVFGVEWGIAVAGDNGGHRAW